MAALSKEQELAIKNIPGCVELEDMDGTWEHVVYRVEHPEKYAPESKYAKSQFS